MPRTLEGRRIVLGPQPDEPPQGVLVRANATAPSNAPAAHQRCRDLLLVVLDFLPDPPAFPTLHEWHQVLPPWYLQACGPERGRAEEEAWLHDGVPPHHFSSDNWSSSVRGPWPTRCTGSTLPATWNAPGAGGTAGWSTMTTSGSTSTSWRTPQPSGHSSGSCATLARPRSTSPTERPRRRRDGRASQAQRPTLAPPAVPPATTSKPRKSRQDPSG